MSLSAEFNDLPIGKKIKQILLMKGKTQEELGLILGKSQQAISYRLENDAFDIPDIKKIAAWLALDPKDFI